MTGRDAEVLWLLPLTEYGEISKETLWNSLEYFLKTVVPEAEKIGMKLALHPNNPQVESIRGISRILNTVENFDRVLNIVPSESNGINFCQGNFSLMGSDIPALIRRWGKAGKIHFCTQQIKLILYDNDNTKISHQYQKIAILHLSFAR